MVLSAKSDGLDIQKIYTFQKGKYDFKVNYRVVNNTAAPWEGNAVFAIKRRGISKETGGVFGLHTYTGAAISSASKPYEKISYKDMDKANLDRSIKGGWLAMQERYFVSTWVPSSEGTLRYFSQAESLGPTDKPADKVYTIGVQTPNMIVPAQGTGNLGLLFIPALK